MQLGDRSEGAAPQGEFALLRVMGEPGSDVFQARSTDGRDVVLRFWRALNEVDARNAIETAKRARGVRHPMLAPVWAVREHADGTLCLVSEYLAGRTLDAWTADLGLPPLRMAVDFVRRLALGLEAAAERGLTHHAVYPGNIHVAEPETTPKGRIVARLADLGVARPQQTLRFEVAHFLAPEELSARLARAGRTVPVTASMNVYSCGCLLHYLCTGQPPFQSDTLGGLTALHTAGAIAVPSQVNRDIPPHLERVIAHALERDPKKRIANPGMLASSLSHVESVWRSSSVRRRSTTVPPPPPPPAAAKTERVSQVPAFDLVLRPGAPTEPRTGIVAKAVEPFGTTTMRGVPQLFHRPAKRDEALHPGRTTLVGGFASGKAVDRPSVPSERVTPAIEPAPVAVGPAEDALETEQTTRAPTLSVSERAAAVRQRIATAREFAAIRADRAVSSNDRAAMVPERLADSRESAAAPPQQAMSLRERAAVVPDRTSGRATPVATSERAAKESRQRVALLMARSPVAREQGAAPAKPLPPRALGWPFAVPAPAGAAATVPEVAPRVVPPSRSFGRVPSMFGRPVASTTPIASDTAPQAKVDEPATEVASADLGSGIATDIIGAASVDEATDEAVESIAVVPVEVASAAVSIDVATDAIEAVSADDASDERVDSIEVAADAIEAVSVNDASDEAVDSIDVAADAIEAVSVNDASDEAVDSIDVAAAAIEAVSVNDASHEAVDSIEVAAGAIEAVSADDASDEAVEAVDSIEVAAGAIEAVSADDASAEAVDSIDVAADAIEAVSGDDARDEAVDSIEVAAGAIEAVSVNDASAEAVEAVDSIDVAADAIEAVSVNDASDEAVDSIDIAPVGVASAEVDASDAVDRVDAAPVAVFGDAAIGAVDVVSVDSSDGATSIVDVASVDAGSDVAVSFWDVSSVVAEDGTATDSADTSSVSVDGDAATDSIEVSSVVVERDAATDSIEVSSVVVESDAATARADVLAVDLEGASAPAPATRRLFDRTLRYGSELVVPLVDTAAESSTPESNALFFDPHETTTAVGEAFFIPPRSSASVSPLLPVWNAPDSSASSVVAPPPLTRQRRTELTPVPRESLSPYEMPQLEGRVSPREDFIFDALNPRQRTTRRWPWFAAASIGLGAYVSLFALPETRTEHRAASGPTTEHTVEIVRAEGQAFPLTADWQPALEPTDLAPAPVAPAPVAPAPVAVAVAVAEPSEAPRAVSDSSESTRPSRPVRKAEKLLDTMQVSRPKAVVQPRTQTREPVVVYAPSAPAMPAVPQGRVPVSARPVVYGELWPTPSVVQAAELRPATAHNAKVAQPSSQPSAVGPQPSAAVRTESLEVRGSISDHTVRRAIERIRPQLNECFTQHSAKSLVANSARVELTIDETGRTRDARVQGVTVALDECLVQASRKLVTGAPDTGTVKVAWNVRYGR